MAAAKHGVRWLSFACHQHHLTPLSTFSTRAAVEIEQRLPRFRTLENDPRLHSEDHVGKFYTIPSNLRNQLFSSGGIPKSLDSHMKVFNEVCVMVRSPCLEIMSYLKNLNYSLPVVRFVLYGIFGSGKSISLMHLIHYAYEEKYLLLHVPWVSNWTKRPKESAPSQWKPERIDLPLESALWLQQFRSQNAELLKILDLKTTKTYSWSFREITEEGSPITDIIDQGVNRLPHASDCVAVLLKEIKYHSQFGKFKSLVIIDGVNAFFCKTNVKRPDKTLVDARDITIVRAFEKLLNNDWNNAACVVSVDVLPFDRNDIVHGPFTPHALLGKHGFELLDPFIPIHVDNYTDKELESALDYYEDRMWIQSEYARTAEGRAQLKFLCGNNPYELMKICDPL